MTDPRNTDDRSQARREAAALLGVDIDHLSPADGLRIDMISSLRLVIDAEQASVLAGSSADLGKLNIAVQSLIALMPGRALPEPESSRHDDHEAMTAPLRKLYRYLHEQVHTLSAENAALRARLGVSVCATIRQASDTVPRGNDMPTSDVTPPAEIGHAIVGKVAGPDDPPPKSTAIIQGRANPSHEPPAKPAWQDWLDRGGSVGGDRWSNRNE